MLLLVMPTTDVDMLCSHKINAALALGRVAFLATAVVCWRGNDSPLMEAFSLNVVDYSRSTMQELLACRRKTNEALKAKIKIDRW